MNPKSPTISSDSLNDLLQRGGLQPLPSAVVTQFEQYLSLILRWNARTNLTAIRDRDEILSRHFLESIACAQSLPLNVRTLLDFGSGAGFPGIPIALCRPEITVSLAEVQGKKAAFLREAIRILNLNCVVLNVRAESIEHPFDAVVLRAVDRMPHAIQLARRLVKPGGALIPMTTTPELQEIVAKTGAEFHWQEPIAIAGSTQRIIAVAIKAGV